MTCVSGSFGENAKASVQRGSWASGWRGIGSWRRSYRFQVKEEWRRRPRSYLCALVLRLDCLVFDLRAQHVIARLIAGLVWPGLQSGLVWKQGIWVSLFLLRSIVIDFFFDALGSLAEAQNHLQVVLSDLVEI